MGNDVGTVAHSHGIQLNVRASMADQLTTVSKLRLVDLAGKISPEEMRKFGEAIKVQLDLR
jgi:mRNA-degrading endonuclease toxin of MazEF toxin-antitoxin module